MLKSLKINNLLSFGSEGVDVELRSLNVLVGPNGSGKSNFLSAIKILQRIPNDVSQFWKSANEPDDWFWARESQRNIYIDCVFDNDLCYAVSFGFNHQTMIIDTELLKDSKGGSIISRSGFNYSVFGDPRAQDGISSGTVMDGKKSVFAFYRDARSGVFDLIEQLNNIKIYSDRPHGSKNSLRNPQLTDMPSDFLSEDFDNLPVVLHELNNEISVEALLLEKLQKFYPRAKRLIMKLVGGRAQVFVTESAGSRSMNVPASRLSDGTLSFLCLLTILCHPTPPPLICIEEPELGLHPDVLPMIAELLVEASQRTQLIVTTHSDLLVSAIGDLMPEAILVCEHTPDEGTTIERPNPERLKKWLQQDDMSLGEVWLRGAIGGTLY